MKTGICGTMESNDCFITVWESDSLKIEIESIVGDFFYDRIAWVIKKTISEMEITNVHIKVIDKGALDFCIKARLIVALSRMEESHA